MIQNTANRELDNDLKELLLKAFTTATVSGSVATFSDGADDVPVKDLVVDIEPVQSGSGDPSPTNIRPITGWTGVNIYRDDDGTATSPTYTVDWTDEAGTVYGGTLDVTTGVLTVDKQIYTFTGSENWSISNSGTSNFYYSWHSAAAIDQNTMIISNMFVGTTITNGNTNTGIWRTYSGAWRIRPSDSEMTLANWKTWLANNSVQAVYTLSTPIATYQLSAMEVATLLGANYIWADTGDVSVTYRRDIDTVLSNLEGN